MALAILPDGAGDFLGPWFQANEGAKFWAKDMSTNEEWSPWTTWDPTHATAPPPDLPVGDLLEADPIVRAEWAGRPCENWPNGRPYMLTGYQFPLQDGELYGHSALDAEHVAHGIAVSGLGRWDADRRGCRGDDRCLMHTT